MCQKTFNKSLMFLKQILLQMMVSNPGEKACWSPEQGVDTVSEVQLNNFIAENLLLSEVTIIGCVGRIYIV